MGGWWGFTMLAYHQLMQWYKDKSYSDSLVFFVFVLVTPTPRQKRCVCVGGGGVLLDYSNNLYIFKNNNKRTKDT